jgi:putative pyoverdin transport system ATP-binding/permease protein
MAIVYFLLKISRIKVLLAIISGILSGLSSAALIMVINFALNNYRSYETTLITLFTLLCVCKVVSGFGSQYFLIHLSQSAVFNLRMMLANQILAAPLKVLEELGSHRLLAALIEDVNHITNAAASLTFLTVNISIVAGCLLYLGYLSPLMLLVVLLFMLCGGFSYQKFLYSSVGYMRKAREETDYLYNHFRSLIGGIKELKIYSDRSDVFITKYVKSTAQALKRSNIYGMVLHAAGGNWGQILFFILIGLSLFLLPRYKSFDNYVLSGYVITVLYMMMPIESILRETLLIGRARIALDNLEKIGLPLQGEFESGSSESVSMSVPGWKQLSLIDVTHSYKSELDDTNFTLGPINLTLYSNELIFIVGGNGSGKTTFAKLLTGLYSPDIGSISIDGISISDNNIDNYRRKFAVVFSDFFLFENLFSLNSSEIEPKLDYYIKQLQLEHKVKVIDDKFSTIKLSQGQQKRLALLFAYLSDREIYLFDEWASDQDPYFKEIFYYQILPELKKKGKTVVVISHDDRYFQVADRVIKLEFGKLSSIQTE